jgi:hypothetical protein
MTRLAFLAASVVALGLSALSANAASVYEATQTLTLTVIQGDDDVSIIYTPDAPFVVADASGGFGTFASASALGTSGTDTNPDFSLTTGSSFDLRSEAVGTAVNNAVASAATSEARKSGRLRLENTGQVAAQIIFQILYDMTWLATVDDPLTETATAEVLWEILLGDTALFSRSFTADAVAGLPGGTEANTPNTLQLIVELDPFEIEELTIRASSKGQATTPAPIPLPAAGWLLIAGLGGLALASRRRAT